MNQILTRQQISTIQRYSAEQRLRYLLTQVLTSKQIWLLCDQYGSVMLNDEGIDCVPIWPNREFAEKWANEEWADCDAIAIPLEKWHQVWTSGLSDDQLAIAIFPDLQAQSLIYLPDEFASALFEQAEKSD